MIDAEKQIEAITKLAYDIGAYPLAFKEELRTLLSSAQSGEQATTSWAARHEHQFTDGHRTLKQDVFSAIHDYAATKPEQDPDDPESWESWFEAAFDLLGTRVGQIFEEHEKRIAANPAPAPALEVEMERLREVLSKLESACEKRAALMSQDVYNAMADLPGMSVALVELDVARMQARRAISASQPNGEV